MSKKSCRLAISGVANKFLLFQNTAAVTFLKLVVVSYKLVCKFNKKFQPERWGPPKCGVATDSSKVDVAVSFFQHRYRCWF